jgi:transcription elongation factor Elf1
MPRFQAKSQEKVGSGRTRIPDFPVHWFSCPWCREDCTIVRTQTRGVTLGCRGCGLHFTMTWHRLAQTMPRSARERWGDDDEYVEEMVALFDNMAPQEIRGRKRS